MAKVISKDGTTIAFDRVGEGPAVILVDGALSNRAFGPMGQLAALLAPYITVITYDRRGRGESGDTPPYAVEREIEDIEALINEAGGSASLYGASSGAALALRAAANLGPDRATRLALFEPPFSSSEEEKRAFVQYAGQMDSLLRAGRRGDAVAFFLADMVPPEALEEMRGSPEWPALEALAHTLAYDNAVMGDDLVPVDGARAVAMPALVLDGSESPEFMREVAAALARALPNARRKSLDGQSHSAAPEVLAPVLVEFFKA
ncbi:MAG TPA: alpha/beta hydrolase [Chloroflexia bacterium]|nr:alpha/beta hydrolase [Chloroflexia bacterium]